MYIHLKTARLTLRRFTAADEDNLVSLNSDPEVMRYIAGGQPTSREEISNEIIPFHLAAYDKHPGFGTRAADDIGTGQFLGWFHLRPRRSDSVIDLGYRLRRSAWGNGYATEGSRALIDKGFTEPDIARVAAAGRGAPERGGWAIGSLAGERGTAYRNMGPFKAWGLKCVSSQICRFSEAFAAL